jgi:two-component system chemotaxis sensor kinase CheA
VTADDELLQAFLEEAGETVDRLDRDLVQLEAAPSDAALLAGVFRSVHTVKGSCGFLDFGRLEALAHAGEDLLGALRAGDVAVDGAVITSLLRLVDRMRAVVAAIEADGTEGDADHADLVAELRAHLDHPAPPSTPPGDGAAATAPPAPPEPAAAPAAEPATDTSIRVDVAVLDRLLDLVGELVLARSQIGEAVADDEEGPLAQPYRKLRLVAAELQHGVMQARLQPVGTVTGRLRRIVRDVATALGKQVELDVEGEDVAVDKAVNEALRDPLLHLVRNAVDHGIERPAERLAAGKPATGRLQVKAFHAGGRVHVEVRDDGRGVDVDRLVAGALDAGVLSPAEAADLGGEAALELMFRPGLTTKTEITSVSGRGVGMDVVRANLEQIGGSIAVSSSPGRGTAFAINVPLTLAILPVLVVWCGGCRYAVPLGDVGELVHLGEGEGTGVADLAGARLHRLRGRLLPVVGLAAELGLPPGRGGRELVVVRTADRRFGLEVDSVGDIADVVVKPLPPAIRAVPVYASVGILGDGGPALVLDVAGLAAGAGVPASDEAGEDEEQGPAPVPEAALLLATVGEDARVAVPLGVVHRLERFDAARVERTGLAEVLHYEDAILPLVRVADVLGAGPGQRGRPGRETADGIQTVVCRGAGGLIGLVVDRVDDVVADPPRPAQPRTRTGVAATVVVDDRLAEVVDVDALAVVAGAWS